ncbi:hypothetical protein [Streptomyces gilvosporeus]|uniref:Uncharacterized protein n=1 Tax=Streptomyces gilvosporeus TaxID=553510 RepID=A0A1V0TJX7_9ACTN|nr:hypothetical protein [Streptomyces gilvosporeus]ARF53246.1 hypothetical protein B1H19_02870 [Streptomyces gilvosporeus]
MRATDLIVPIELHAMVYNWGVQGSEPFHRWFPTYQQMLRDQGTAEPTPSPSPPQQDLVDKYGVYLQWQLPEALATGHYDPESRETTFPLIPNRWLIVRYYDGTDGTRKAAGWVVASDFLHSEHPDWNPGTERRTQYVNPRGDNAPFLDFIGRADKLEADRPWREPARREPHLTAIGPGVPAFAAFEPYHRNVLSFYDSLNDLRPHPTAPAPDNTFSYLAIGWYTERGIDLLTTAADIPGLLPPDAEGPEDVIHALHWALPEGAEGSALTDSRYVGTALGIPWQQGASAPPSDKPDYGRVKVAVGHSTDDAAGALTAHQTRSGRTADLLRALYHGTIDTFDGADGSCELDDATRKTWFAGRTGGYAWEIVDRPTENGDPPARHRRAEDPGWLADLNSLQAAYDALEPRLRHSQQRYWSLHWLRGLPSRQRPEGFAEAAWEQLRPDRPGNLHDRTAALHQQAVTLLAGLPHGSTPEELQAAIDAYAAAHGLPEHLELKRVAAAPFHQPADPVLLIEGSGATQPLTRDTDHPLPCRIPDRLLESAYFDGAWHDVPTSPPAPELGGDVPAVCAALLPEFALLDTAARTPASGPGPTALHNLVADPSGLTRGLLAEYTAVWRQPWLPMFVQWDLRYSPTPYHSENRDNWEFDGDDYAWLGTGSTVGSEEDARQRVFRGRAFLAPTTVHVLRGQLRRYLETFPEPETAGLAALREDCKELDVLSQSLDGLNDWLLRQDGAARLVPDAQSADLTGDGSTVPRPGPREQSAAPEDVFQPVRAGQFFFTDLRIIDRYGRVLDIVADNEGRPERFDPRRAVSVTPTPGRRLFEDVRGDQRFIQLPPRMLHEARVRLDTVDAHDGSRYATGPRAADVGAVTGAPADVAAGCLGAGAGAGAGPVAGWLLLNYLDRTLLVYGPDGAPLGELRVVRNISGVRATAWNPLPHSPYDNPGSDAFKAAFPQLSGFATELLRQSAASFDDLMESIDEALERVESPHAEDDRTAARLLGRPLALVRADLGIDLRGPLLTDAGWQTVIDPPQEEYPQYTWPVRLGEAERLSDGLIGYYATEGEPGDAISYRRLHAVAPVDDSGYTVPIGHGEGLALPARITTEDPVTHHLTLLADPHAPVHASTGILPIEALELPADLVHQALLRIRASFRLNPLLAPLRNGQLDARRTAGVDSVRTAAGPGGADELPEGLVMPQPAQWHGTWTWAEPELADGAELPTWSETPLAPADTRFHADDPAPAARAGYLQLHPVQEGPSRPA